MAATAGNELINLDARLAAILESLTLPSALWKASAGWCADASKDGPWAVRSSSLVEDGTVRSHAGLYELFLIRTTLADVAEAVIPCRASFYSPRAVLARLRAGDIDAAPRILGLRPADGGCRPGRRRVHPGRPNPGLRDHLNGDT